MSIVLLILKIIGIVLLAVLGLLLLAVACLLFVPVRYRIRGEAGVNINVRIRVSWLLHILSFRADFDGKDFKKKLKVLGIPLRGKKRKPKRAGKKRKAKEPGAEASEPNIEPEQKAFIDIPGKKDDGMSAEEAVSDIPEKEEIKELAEKTATFPEEASDTAPKQNMLLPEENRVAEISHVRRKKKHCFVKLRSFFQKIRQLPGMIRSKWETLKGKIKGWKKTLNGLLSEVKKEENLEALKAIWNEVRFILRHSSPRRIRAEASFSLGDPANTGQALGLISILPLVYRYQINLCPDFEAERMYFEGTFDIKGTVYGIHALILLIHLFTDKNIRGLIETYHK